MWDTEAQRGQAHRWAHAAARHLDLSQVIEKGEKRVFLGAPFLWHGLNIMAMVG